MTAPKIPFRPARQGQDTLAAIVATSDDAILSKDMDGIIQTWNAAAERLYGYSADEIIGKSVATLMPPELPDEFGAIMERLKRGERVDHYDTVRVHKDGHRIEVSISVSPVSDASGALVGAASIAREIGERKRLEGERQEVVDRLGRLQEVTATLGDALTPDAVAEAVARQAMDALGAEAVLVGAVNGDQFHILHQIHGPNATTDPCEDFPLSAMLPVTEAIRGGEPLWLDSPDEFRERYPDVAADIAAPSFAFAVVPLVSRGHAIGALALRHDSAREMRRTERLFLLALAQHAAQALDRSRLYEEARALNRAKDEFQAMLAHELRNPIGAISNALLLLEGVDATDPSATRYRGIASRQMQHVVRLLDDLLDVSRITRGRVALRLSCVSLSAIVEEAAHVSGPGMERRRHRLTVDLPDDPLWVHGDVDRLNQVLRNLLDNAAKYTPEGGDIRIRARREGETAVVSVRDDGAGIPADLLPRIFDLFTQADRSLDRAEGGMGIGLSLVTNLVQMHGGTVEALSDGPGRGSEFIIRIPLVEAALLDASSAEAPSAAPAPEDVHPDDGAMRVLLVEDNPDAAETLSEILRFWGHDVRTAPDGPAALETFEAYRPDVALLDIGLPGMDGFEVAQRLRTLDGGGDATLIALSGYTLPDDRTRGKAAGFDEHLAKPLDPEALRRILESLPRQA